MILGIGSDLADIRRIQKSLDRFGERFVNRCFTEIEQRRSEAKADRAASYAKRFAAKEACAKALGTGIRGIAWKEMGVVNQKSGRPTIALTGKAAARLAAMTPEGMTAVVHVTLTDDHPYAQAFVIIEARPDDPVRTSPSLAGPESKV